MTLNLISPFRWAGGKRKLTPYINALYSKFRDTHPLVEPFVGGGSIFLSLEPDRAFLNDLNPYLISSYLWLSQGGVRNISTPRSPEEYYELRSQFNEFDRDDLWMGEAFWLLNRLGFNGLCRFNQKGKYNVPVGYKSNKELLELPDLDLSSYAPLLKSCSFSKLPYQEFIEGLKEPCFIYADPPYYQTYTGYTGREFTFEDQEKLAQMLIELKQPVVISNCDHPKMIELYQSKGYQITVLNNIRNNAINCNGKGRDKVREIIAFAYLS